MNDETAKLIQQLADKLGTTAEHLWGVLVRQAPLAATWGIFELFIDGAIAALFWVIARKLVIRAAKMDDDGSDELALFACYASAFVCGVIALVFTVGFMLGDLGGFATTLAGFFNPEYWAFKQVVK